MTAGTLDEVALRLLGADPRAGVLYGVGAGPGDPSLVTVRGAALLRRLDVVVVPRSERGGGVVATAVAPYVDPHRILELVTDMPVDAEAVRDGWAGRVGPVVDALESGATVGFVTNGDPSLYSTFTHLTAAVLAVRPGTELAVVPGVPAMCAASALEAVPLVVGAERLAVVPASRIDDSALRRALDGSDTVVLLKAGAALDRVRALLAGPARGWSVHYARRVGLPAQEHGDGLDGATTDYVALAILRRPRPGAGGAGPPEAVE